MRTAAGFGAAFLSAVLVTVHAAPAPPRIVTWDDLRPPAARGGGAPELAALRGAMHVRSGLIRPSPGVHLRPETGTNAPGGIAPARAVYVLCAAPVQKGLADMLAACGSRVLAACPPNTYLVRATSAAVQRMAAAAPVTAVVELEPARKIGPALAARTAQANAGARLTVELSAFPDVEIETLAARVADTGGRVTATHPRVRAAIVDCPAPAVANLAALTGVEFVDLHVPAQLLLKGSTYFCDADAIRLDPHHLGAGVAVGVIDSGFEVQHTAFGGQWGPQEWYPALNVTGWNVSGDGADPDTWDDPNGHGTHVLGILLSRWADPFLEGISPWIGSEAATPVRCVRCGKDNGSGRLYHVDQAIARLTNTDSACLAINNSWGNRDPSGNDAVSRLVDAAAWDHEQLWVFAAGNSGPAPGSIGSPGAAKNVLAVGNLLNNCTLDVAHDSSRGPTLDGRYKPEIYAPGAPVESASAFHLSGSLYGWGTSMAAPHVTAVAATLMDYLPAFQRKPAMTKAHLIATARRLSTLGDERAGLLDSWNAHVGDSTPRFFTSFADGVEQGGELAADWTLPRSCRRMICVLTWMEPPATPSALYVVNNNIDLRVDYGADGSDEWSSTSLVDNFECIVVTNAAAGTYRFRVQGTSIAGPHRIGLAVLGTGSTADDAYEDNNDAPSAFDLGAYEGVPLSAIDGNGVLNEPDWYRIDVPAGERRVVITCTHSLADGDIDMGFWNAVDPIQIGYATTGNATETIDMTVDHGGAYYIELYPYGGGPDIAYDLQWNAYASGAPIVPALAFDSLAIDDDNEGGSSGNGDGLINPGEVIELSVILRNTGTATAEEVFAHLVSNDAGVDDVSIADAPFPDIPAGAARQSTRAFHVHVAPDAGHLQTLTVHLDPIAATGARWTDAFTVTVHDPEGDLDGDGMPNWWEEQYCGNPTNLYGLADPDGDTLNNWMEWVAMTAPNASSSCFRVTAIGMSDPSRPVLHWPSASNRVYHVTRGARPAGPFAGVASNLTASPPVNTYTDTLDAATGPAFYRVHVALPE